MPGPTTSLATFRPDIPGAMEEFSLEMNEAGYIGLQAAPVCEVGSSAESIGKIPIQALLQEVKTNRAPGSSYNTGDWEFEKFSYATEEHGWKEAIDDRLRKLYSRFFDAEVIATKRARGFVSRNLEKRIAALYAAIATTTAAGTAWSSANSTPMVNVETAANVIADRTGYWPNALILSKKKARQLRFVNEIIDRCKYNGIVDVTPDKIGPAILAQVFDVEMVLIAGAKKNTANAKQDPSLSSIWPDNEAYLAVVSGSEDPVSPGFARTFHWGEDGSTIGGVVERYRDEDRRSDMVRSRMDTDEVVVYAEMAQRITGV
jgi:hypothetical protein